MRTLHHWEAQLLAVPNTIECPIMTLHSFHDSQPPVFSSPGYIEIKDFRSFEFTMFASSSSDKKAIERLGGSQRNPYDVQEQFRLEAIDYQGVEWGGGWTSLQIKGLPRRGWPLTGRLRGLVTQATGQHVSQESSVELIYQPTLLVPMDKAMISITTIDELEIARSSAAGQHIVDALDTHLEFSYSPADKWLRVRARTSNRFQHPYAENLLSEPFTVLFGELIYPRLVARNFGDGRAQVWLRSSPHRHENSRVAALFENQANRTRTEFWNLYKKLLTMFADARDGSGGPNFDRHPLTRLYEEIIQASQGSRWVQCLAFASAGEGLAKMLMRPEERQSEIDPAEIASLRNAVAKWNGNSDLKKMILSDISRRGEMTIGRYLRKLEGRGVLESRNVTAWSSIRHEVMHGKLVSPWGTEEEDRKILDLADLVHRLSLQLIREKTDTTLISN